MIAVWACKQCGRCSGSDERCRVCSGTMAQLAEEDAIQRFRLYWEPPTGWADDATMRADWRADRVYYTQGGEHG